MQKELQKKLQPTMRQEKRKNSSSEHTGIDGQKYRTIERAIGHIRANAHAKLSLEDIAREVGMEKYVFHRLFFAWAGTTPERFAKYLTKEHAKNILRDSHSVMEATYASGLSGPGRLHDLFVTYEAMSPGEWKHGGIDITYGVFPSPFGECLIAATPRGICHLSFIESENPNIEIKELRERWPRATFVRDEKKIQPVFQKIFEVHSSSAKKQTPIHLLVRGTNFQIKVWEALMRIPAGRAASYGDIAREIGNPKASRAVGSACGANEIALLIPCHRVLQANGALGSYRWGANRKEVLLAWESVKKDRNV